LLGGSKRQKVKHGKYEELENVILVLFQQARIIENTKLYAETKNSSFSLIYNKIEKIYTNTYIYLFLN